jgi:hypothetical protein
MGDNINANQAGSGGNPASGTIVPDVDGLADPFEHPRINGLLGWSRTVSPARVENDKWGRPYLYFHDADTRWLVSMGPNGEYDGLAAGSDDLELYITE